MCRVVSPKNIVPERGEGSGANRRRRRPGPTTQPIGNGIITTTPGNSTLVLVRLTMKAEGGGSPSFSAASTLSGITSVVVVAFVLVVGVASPLWLQPLYPYYRYSHHGAIVVFMVYHDEV